jgi:hypothetical protein
MNSEGTNLETKADWYISSLIEPYRNSTGLDETALDILGQFAWEKDLSAYQIHSKLKPTPEKLAYKNVNTRINVLLDSGLIQETECIGTNNKHGARYYTLTEYGIFRLFLDRVGSFMEDQSDVRKDRKSSPSQNALTFLDNYSDSALFDVFLYPYFMKETLLAIGGMLLLKLYPYLEVCCQGIARAILEPAKYCTKSYEKIFSWEKVPGEDEMKLLYNLQHMLNLKKIVNVYVKKEDNIENPTITVSPPCAPPIKLELDKAKNRVSIMSTVGGQFKELQYEATQMDQNETWVSKRIPSKEAVIEIVNYALKEIEPMIYKLVCCLAPPPLATMDIDKKFSYDCDILSKDDKFMRMVEKTCEDMHKSFDKGYEMLSIHLT